MSKNIEKSRTAVAKPKEKSKISSPSSGVSAKCEQNKQTGSPSSVDAPGKPTGNRAKNLKTKSRTTTPTTASSQPSIKQEEYMSPRQLEHFRTILLEWKNQLMGEVDRTVDHLQQEGANYPDPVDRANQEEEFSAELRTRDRERKLLRKIEEALNRIKDGDYGYCDDCGAEIGIERLEARPTATQCIECKTIAEVREKQLGDYR